MKKWLYSRYAAIIGNITFIITWASFCLQVGEQTVVCADAPNGSSTATW